MNRNRSGEAGVVSLMVTLVMMIVITLIVLGFAEIARNEQRSSLDDQLSTQAYYAAESGVNDVRAKIADDVKNGVTPTDNLPGDCSLQGEYSTLNRTVDSSHNASYTCVTVDTHPTTLSYSIGYASTVVPIASFPAGTPFTSLQLKWTATGTGVGACLAGGSNPNTFSAAGSWGCPSPVVRVDLVKVGGAFSRSNWNANTETTFFVPFNSNVVANNGALTDRGNAVGARCTANASANTTTCTANICAISSCVGNLGASSFYARFTTIYQTNVQLSINDAALVKFNGAQAKVDSTGKAQDVLRRVLVAVDLTDANVHPIPSAAIVSRDSVCKRFSVTKTSFQVYDDLTPGGGNNPFCDQASSNGSPTP